MPDPVSLLELIFPKPWTRAMAQVHGPLSTEALTPIWVRSSVADCSARGTSIAVRLWSTKTPTLGARRAPNPRRRPGLTPVADENALRAGPGRNSISLRPEARPVRCFGGAAAARKKCKIPSAGADLPSVLREHQ